MRQAFDYIVVRALKVDGWGRRSRSCSKPGGKVILYRAERVGGALVSATLFCLKNSSMSFHLGTGIEVVGICYEWMFPWNITVG